MKPLLGSDLNYKQNGEQWKIRTMTKRTMNKLTMKKAEKSGRERKHLTTVRRNVEERRCGRCCGKSRRWCGHGVSPNIYPPFKGVTTRHDRWNGTERNSVEVESSDLAGSSRVFPIEFQNEFRSMNVVPSFPRVMFNTETFPFRE